MIALSIDELKVLVQAREVLNVKRESDRHPEVHVALSAIGAVLHNSYLEEPNE